MQWDCRARSAARSSLRPIYWLLTGRQRCRPRPRIEARVKNANVDRGTSAPILPEPPVAAAVDKFSRDDPTPYLVVVLFDDRPEMAAYGLVGETPPERVRVDSTPVESRLEVVRHGMRQLMSMEMAWMNWPS